jgi:predicted CopG family antitoxin
MTTRSDMKMIRVDDDTHDRLKEHGKFGESFQDIIIRLMDIVEGKATSSKK